MAWLVAGAIFVAALALLPAAMRAVRRSARGKGGMAGAMLGLGMVFAHLFEPAKATATEEIDRQKRLGTSERSSPGEKF